LGEFTVLGEKIGILSFSSTAVQKIIGEVRTSGEFPQKMSRISTVGETSVVARVHDERLF
jgi:hypothetical protein